MQNKSTSIDATEAEPVQLPADGLIFPKLRAALRAADEPRLRALVPGLTKKEAASLFFHTNQQAARSGAFPTTYGRDAWGTAVPAVVLSATRKVRVAAFLAWGDVWCYSLGRADAERIIPASMASEIEDGEFWELAVYTASMRDLDAGRALSNARRKAKTASLIFEYRDDLRAAHEAAQQVLAAVGLPWGLLDEWRRGNHGDEHAIEQQAKAEAGA